MKQVLMFLVLPIGAALTVLFVLGETGDHGRHESTVTVGRAPEDVFAWIIQPELERRWRRDLTSTEAPELGAFQVGQRWSEVVTRDGEEIRLLAELKEIVPGERLVVERTGPGFRTRITYVLAEEGKNTLLHYTCKTERESFFARLFAPLTATGDEARQDEDLSRLRAQLDSGM
jgi:uncharacterized protein YndB with AHSA1/START domain